MEAQRNRDVVSMEPPNPSTDPVYVVEQNETPARESVEVPVPAGAHVAREREVERVESFSTFAPHAIAAGILAVLMLVWGGVAMARAGFGGDLREPTVEVFGFVGNAISGAIVAGLGLLLLVGAVSRDRGPVVFVTIVSGIAGLIVAFEPDVADGALGVETALPLALAVGSALVLLVALAVPTVSRHSERIERH